MGLSDIVRKGIAVANSVTASLQVQVEFEAWVKTQGTGSYLYAPKVLLNALVEDKQGMMRDSSGIERPLKSKLTIIGPVDPTGADERTDPIDVRDKFTLPDGSTGPILKVAGLVDPSTGRPYMYEVYLGDSNVGS